MTPEPIQLTITNICEGGVPEVFMREVRAVLENIADTKTSPDGKRKITLTFEFEPTPDRGSAIVSFQCTSKTLSAEAKVGTIYFAKRLGRVEAFISDPRQEVLFGEEPTKSPTKQ